MKKFLIGSLVLPGLLIVSCSNASAQDRDRNPPPRGANVPNLQDQVAQLTHQLQQLQHQLNESQRHQRHEAPNPQFHQPTHQVYQTVHSAQLLGTLERILVEKQREREDRELAEALQCLLDKAKPKSHHCDCAKPACEYVKPNCAPITCSPTPCPMPQR